MFWTQNNNRSGFSLSAVPWEILSLPTGHYVLIKC